MQQIVANVIESQKELKQYLIQGAQEYNLPRDNIRLIQLVVQNIDYILELLEKFESVPEELTKFLDQTKSEQDAFVRYAMIKEFFFS